MLNSIQSIEQITDELLRHGLLDDESIGVTCLKLEKRGEAITGANLLSALVADGKLTPFQAHEVSKGRANQLILGNYLILSRLGEGGMGVVYKALHRRMQRVVAIKLIRKEVATRDFISRFRREIQLSARLNHPNVVIAYDSDQCPMGDFLVMEYVEGTDLSDVLRRTGTLSLPDAISAIQQAAMALAYAHRQGIVHRDIKPANLLRDINGCVKVVDMGLARVTVWEGAKGAELTQLGAVSGTVDYMSPEQADNPLEVDQRSDIYSLGCTLFALLTGGPVFTKSTLIGRILAHRTEMPPRLSDARPEVPPALDAIFQRMLAKAPDDRYASMDEVIDALDTLTHPLSESESTAIVMSKSPVDPWNAAAASVLIAEESKLQSSIFKKLLKEIGVTDVHACQTGGEILDRLTNLAPKIVLSSLRLPDMSGMELAGRIRDEFRWLETGLVLMSTDDWTESNRTTGERLGRLRLLKKPFDAAALQAAIRGALSDKSREEKPIEGLNELRVLIVDDSNVARRNAQNTLNQIGFTRFTQADDGDTAVSLLEESRFDLIITDYHMPRMDGRQLITHIRQKGPQKDVPIIMVTTEFDPQKLAAIYQLGVSAICNKTFDLEMVRNIVIRLFAR